MRITLTRSGTLTSVRRERARAYPQTFEHREGPGNWSLPNIWTPKAPLGYRIGGPEARTGRRRSSPS